MEVGSIDFVALNRKARRGQDSWARAAREGGWRSRAVFKLQEIDTKHKLFRRGTCVVDLGAAPGAWSQYALSRVGKSGYVVAIDLLEMQPLPGVDILRGDVRAPEGVKCLRDCLGDRRVDLVISDMAPNITGIASVDMPAALELARVADDIARALLAGGGFFLVKLFQGTGFGEYLSDLRRCCSRVAVIKPSASRPESRETYALARF